MSALAMVLNPPCLYAARCIAAIRCPIAKTLMRNRSGCQHQRQLLPLLAAGQAIGAVLAKLDSLPIGLLRNEVGWIGCGHTNRRCARTSPLASDYSTNRIQRQHAFEPRQFCR